jgi:putative pyruvate formate lyase activating enzyme
MNKKAKLKAKLKSVEKSARALYPRLKSCDICPRECKVNRQKGEKGFCGVGKGIPVYTAFLHSGEEPPISGTKGSGTIFFSGCNLQCVYCQNYKFSHLTERKTLRGKVLNEKQLAFLMGKLQEKGAHNINLVTPTHLLPQILQSLAIALKRGLEIPIVYNTSGYEKKSIIEQLEGVIDIFLADMRYFTQALASRYSNAADYPQRNQESLLAMQDCIKATWERNLLTNGLIVRHLVLPGYLQETKATLSWIKQHLDESYLSLMFQYRPYFFAQKFPEINRRVTFEEYKEIIKFLSDQGIEGWIQEFDPPDHLAGVNFFPRLEI